MRTLRLTHILTYLSAKGTGYVWRRCPVCSWTSQLRRYTWLCTVFQVGKVRVLPEDQDILERIERMWNRLDCSDIYCGKHKLFHYFTTILVHFFLFQKTRLSYFDSDSPKCRKLLLFMKKTQVVCSHVIDRRVI